MLGSYELWSHTVPCPLRVQPSTAVPSPAALAQAALALTSAAVAEVPSAQRSSRRMHTQTAYGLALRVGQGFLLPNGSGCIPALPCAARRPPGRLRRPHRHPRLPGKMKQEKTRTAGEGRSCEFRETAGRSTQLCLCVVAPVNGILLPACASEHTCTPVQPSAPESASSTQATTPSPALALPSSTISEVSTPGRGIEQYVKRHFRRPLLQACSDSTRLDSLRLSASQ